MAVDKNSILRDIEGFQDRIDKVFHRANEDPAYRTIQQLKEAISDNPRFYPNDRKMELAEILFALLDLIYEQTDDAPGAPTELNPLAPGASLSAIPDYNMFLRDIMPLSWGISTSWAWPELSKSKDFYLSAFTEKEIPLISQILEFLFDLFPAPQDQATMVREVRTYWHDLATAPEQFRLETEEEKSKLLPILLAAAKKNKVF